MADRVPAVAGTNDLDDYSNTVRPFPPTPLSLCGAPCDRCRRLRRRGWCGRVHHHPTGWGHLCHECWIRQDESEALSQYAQRAKDRWCLAPSKVARGRLDGFIDSPSRNRSYGHHKQGGHCEEGGPSLTMQTSVVARTQ